MNIPSTPNAQPPAIVSLQTSLHEIFDERLQGSARSPEWHRVEEAHIKAEPWCRNCGGTKNLQVHHVEPFHLHPEKELDPTNLITLCEDYHDGVECHLHIGHLGNWKNFNPYVRLTANSPSIGIPATHITLATNIKPTTT